jgi:hypothetical protein
MKPSEILFPTETARIKMRMCPFCSVGVNPGDFRDPISLREYEISGLCQHCQDEVFGS